MLGRGIAIVQRLASGRTYTIRIPDASVQISTPSPLATAWRVTRSLLWGVAAAVGIMGGIGFAEFIFEEGLQSTGIAVGVALKADAVGAAEDAANGYAAQLAAAQAFHRRLGWLCPWMSAAYGAYFDSAAPAQLRSARLSIAARRPALPALRPYDGQCIACTAAGIRCRAAAIIPEPYCEVHDLHNATCTGDRP